MISKRDAFILLYRIFISPLAIFLAVTLGRLFVPKIREGLRLRRLKRVWPRLLIKPIWIHASSGEFEYAKPFIRALKAKHPTAPIVVSYFSPSYAKVIETFPGVDFTVPLPLDLPAPCREFLKKLSPQAGFIARTDLWPELLVQAELQKIPMYLFSATKTRITPIWRRWFDRWLWSYIRVIFCVTESDANHILAVDPKVKCLAIGDTRFDQVIERLKNPRPTKSHLKPNRATTLVAGSTWREDEAVLIAAFSEALKSKKLQLLIAPHEPTPEHCKHLHESLAKHGLRVAFYSTSTNSLYDALIIDQVGILAELYQWGAFALVGGSFKGSVHSVMEPLAAGAFTLVGPFHHNNREALEFQSLSVNGVSMVQVAKDALEINTSTLQALAKWDAATATLITREIENRAGASLRLVDFLDLRTNPVLPDAQI